MFNILINAFGDKLLLLYGQQQLMYADRFPTLRQLRGKVIIKTDSKLDELKSYQGSAMERIEEQPQFVLGLERGPFPSHSFNQRY